MIKTQRLIVKPFAPEDALDFFNLTLDEGFNLYPITIYRQESIERAQEWIMANQDKYGVRTQSSKELIGMGGLLPWKWKEKELTDVTYRLRTSAWGRGLGLELALGLRDYALRKGMPTLSATITPDNMGSKKIAEKLGMKFVERITLKNVPTDLYWLAT
jgi:RimJ/RimL family protein N-acetyltransferase